MWRVSIGLVVVVAGCGRIGFDATRDAGSGGGDDATDGGPTFVASCASQISAGANHTCAVSGGQLWCWGFNGNGELGLGTDRQDRRIPTLVPGLTAIAQVAAGQAHTCARDEATGTFCWGQNGSGQLGNGSTTSSGTPTRALIPATSMVISGNSHVCSVDQGGLHCWGFNLFGQIGDSTMVDVPTPFLFSLGSNVRGFGLGTWHTCGVDSFGQTYCWGRNSEGQLATGDYAQHIVASAIMGGSPATAIAAGGETTCTITGANAMCWGSNSRGQLGIGSLQLDSPVPQLVSDIEEPKRITVGLAHACAIDRDGLACWGANSSGELGIGMMSTGATITPQLVPLMSVVEISAGGSHTCAIRVDGSVWCWGSNVVGQLGDGTVNPTATPTQVLGPC